MSQRINKWWSTVTTENCKKSSHSGDIKLLEISLLFRTEVVTSVFLTVDWEPGKVSWFLVCHWCTNHGRKIILTYRAYGAVHWQCCQHLRGNVFRKHHCIQTNETLRYCQRNTQHRTGSFGGTILCQFLDTVDKKCSYCSCNDDGKNQGSSKFHPFPHAANKWQTKG